MKLTKRQSEALDVKRHVSLRAGAGSGKTHVLTERYLALLEKGVPAESIVTITFTRKAANQMRDRVRKKIAIRIKNSAAAGDKDGIRFWESALDALPDATISTIHSFCSGILREDPIGAGVDPEFEAMDETASTLLLVNSITDFINTKKDDPGYEPLRVLAPLWTSLQLVTILRSLFGKRNKAAAWARETAAVTDEDMVERQRNVSNMFIDAALSRTWLDEMLETLESLRCEEESDLQYSQLAIAVSGLRRLAAPECGGIDKDAILSLAGLVFNGGSKKNWAPGDLDKWKAVRGDIREKARELNKFTFSEEDEKSIPVQKALAGLFLGVLDEYEARKGNGRILDFDDQQEIALAYIVNTPRAAAALRRKYTHIMVDEFQDTNGLQWELVKAITHDGTGFSGNVFVVGDEKQSIYGFRGADVGVFRDASGELNEAGGAGVELDVNFRSHPRLLAFFNELFCPAFNSPPDSDTSGIRCEAVKPGRQDEISGPGVCVISCGKPADDREYSNRHELEAELVAGRLKDMLGSEPALEIMDPEEREMRSLEQKDIAVLFRSRTHVDAYQDAFRRHGLDFINVGGFGFFEAPEITDHVKLLSFLADPRDEVALAAVLRSPMFHMSDEELLRVALAGEGRTFFGNLVSYAKNTGENCSAAFAATMLDKWMTAAGHATVSELLMNALDETGAWGIYAAGERGDQSILNVRKLLGLAREHEMRHRGGLRSFLERLSQLRDADVREGEAPVAGIESSGVRFMTVHSAKGLEFPVVVVANLQGQYQYGSSDSVYMDDVFGRTEVGLLLKGIYAGENDEHRTAMREIVKSVNMSREREEQRRLLYVACTRAMDYLVLAGYDAGLEDDPKKIGKDPGSWAEEIARALRDEKINRKLQPLVEWLAPVEPERAEPGIDAECRVDDFLRELDAGPRGAGDEEALRYFGDPPPVEEGITVSVTDLQLFRKDPGQYYRERLIGIPSEWSDHEHSGHGHRYHPGVDPMTRGTAVHKLFEILPSVLPDELESRFTDILLEENVPEGEDARKLADKYVPMARRFAESEIGRAVCGENSFREMPFSLRIGPHTVTGQIDVLFEGADGWQVLDYKSDHLKPGEEDKKLGEYGVQLELYSLAVLHGLGVNSVSAGLYLIETEMATGMHTITTENASSVESGLLEILDEMVVFRKSCMAR